MSGEPDRLWRNRGDGTFEDVTAGAGLRSPSGKGMGVVFTDLDLDGVADLFVTTTISKSTRSTLPTPSLIHI